MTTSHMLAAMVAVPFLLAGCAAAPTRSTGTPQPRPPGPPLSPAPGAPAAAPPSAPPTLEAPPPSGAEREFRTDFSRHTVDYSEILSGGPPKDGIPALDHPQFISVDQADGWLQPQEP